MNQLLDFCPREVVLRLYLIHNPIRHRLLAHLAIINFLFHCVVGNEPIDVTSLLLSVTVHATDSLGIVARIPGRVQDYDAVSSDQIDAQTACSSRQQKQPGCSIWLVECVYEALPLNTTSTAIQTYSCKTKPVYICLQCNYPRKKKRLYFSLNYA